MKPAKISKQELEHIWHEVPVDYYQKGTQKNILQKLWHSGKLRAVFSFFPEHPKRILDVGSASGWFLSQLHHRYPEAECHGVDVYKDAIEYGKKIYPDIHLQVADAHTLPFKDKFFDVVINTEVLEHVVDPDAVLKEMYRVLSPGGTMIVEMDSGNFLFQLSWHWWTHMRRGVWRDAHIQVFTANKLEQTIQDADLHIVNKKYFNATMAVVFQIQKSR